MQQFVRNERVVGMMVIDVPNNDTASDPAEGFSSVEKCPNELSGQFANNRLLQYFNRNILSGM